MNIRVITLLFCFTLWTNIVAQYHQWEMPSILTSGEDVYGPIGSMVMDSENTTYLSIVFNEEISIYDTTLYSSTEQGLALYKLNVNHELIWAKLIAEAKALTPTSSRVISGLGVTFDNSLNIFATVGYKDSTYIDGQLYTVDQSEYSSRDVTILKLTSEGEAVDTYHIKGSCWTSSSTEIIDDKLYFSLSISRNNLDTGTCTCIINQDTTLYVENNHAYFGTLDVNSGEVDWVKAFHAQGTPLGGSLIVKNNKLYLVGSVFYNSDLYFEDGIIDIPEIIYSRYGFLAQLDMEGNLEWSTYFAVNGWDSHIFSSNLVFNGENDIVLVGGNSSQSVSSVIFFPDAPDLFGPAGQDNSFFIVNYDTLGNVKWNDISQSTGITTATSVDTDKEHNLYLAGSFNAEIKFGSDTLTSHSVLSDILIVSYDSLGNKRWAKKAGGIGDDGARYIEVDSLENLHILGSIGYTSTFGTHEVTPIGSGNFLFLTKMLKEPLKLLEHQDEFALSLHPNPSTGLALLALQNETLKRVHIYDVSGRAVQVLGFEETTKQVSIQGLSAGTYILDIHTASGKRAARKLIVN